MFGTCDAAAAGRGGGPRGSALEVSFLTGFSCFKAANSAQRRSAGCT